jgi:hypothetical protein
MSPIWRDLSILTLLFKWYFFEIVFLKSNKFVWCSSVFCVFWAGSGFARRKVPLVPETEI